MPNKLPITKPNTLVMSILDLAHEPNQRTQHMVQMLADISSEVVVITKARSLDRSLLGLIRDACVCRYTTSAADNIQTLRIHPFLNYAQALATGWVSGNVNQPAGLIKRTIGAALSCVGILRDLFLIPTFLIVALFKTRQHVDICFVDSPWTAAAGFILRAMGRVNQLIYDDIDYVAGGQSLKLRIAYVAALERSMIRHADLVISAGWRLGAYRKLSCDKAIEIIPNGVDPARFIAALNKRPHPPTLVYMGHLAYYCGIDLAIRSLADLHHTLPNARLFIIGEGDQPYIDGLKALTTRLNLQRHVIFHGKVPYDHLATLLAECDLGLANSRPTLLRNFAFPLKVIEYMAAGLPVICTQDSEAAEILARHPAGVAIPFDQAHLTIACMQLLSNQEQCQQAQSTALQTAQLFTWQAATSAMQRAILNKLQAESCPAFSTAELGCK